MKTPSSSVQCPLATRFVYFRFNMASERQNNVASDGQTNTVPSAKTIDNGQAEEGNSAVLIQVKCPEPETGGEQQEDFSDLPKIQTEETNFKDDNHQHEHLSNGRLQNGEALHASKRVSISDALPGTSRINLQDTGMNFQEDRSRLGSFEAMNHRRHSVVSSRSLWANLRNAVRKGSAIAPAKKRKKKKSDVQRMDSFLLKFTIREREKRHSEDYDKHDEAHESDGDISDEEEEDWTFVFDPVGDVKFYWLTVVVIAIVYNFWTIIVREAWPAIHTNCKALWFTLDYVCDVIYFWDIFVQMRTGYLEQGILVVDDKKLAMNYIKSRYFILDAISLTPLDFFYLATDRTHTIIRFPRFLKGYRYASWLKLAQSRSAQPNILRVGNLCNLILLLMHWFACVYFIICDLIGFGSDNWVYPIPDGEYAPIIRQYLASFYWSTLTLTMLGDVPDPETEWEYFFQILAYLMGLFIFATIVGQISTVIENRNASRLQFERHVDSVKKYMRAHDVPKDVQERIQRWYDYTWDLDEGDVNALVLLPDKMRTELALHVNLKTLKKVTIFNECPPEFLHDLVLRMKTSVFTPGDLVCRKGEVAREMFIISDGLLEVLGTNGTIVTTLSAGDYFGEIGILNIDGVANRRTADVRSVGYSSLFTLSKDDVLLALQDYPQAEHILALEARRRIKDQLATVGTRENEKLDFPATIDGDYSSLSEAQSGDSDKDLSEDPESKGDGMSDREKRRLSHQGSFSDRSSSHRRMSMADVVEMTMNMPKFSSRRRKTLLQKSGSRQPEHVPRGLSVRRKTRAIGELYDQHGDEEDWATELASSIEYALRDKMDEYQLENKYLRRRNADIESRIRVLQHDNEAKDEKLSLLWRRIVELEDDTRTAKRRGSKSKLRKEAFVKNDAYEETLN